MRHTLLSLCGLALLACGGTVSTTTTSGTGGSTSTSSTTTGSTTTGSGGSTSTSTGTGGAGGAAACVGFFDVTADNGAPVHYGSACENSFGSNESSTALGYEFSGGPAPGVQALTLIGCVSAAAKSEGIFLSLSDALGPGTFTKGSVTWTDPGGITWGVEGDPLSAEVTALGQVGGVIEGHFTAMVTHGGNAAHNVEGTFHVCRVNDLLAP
jgi:hypothetical protein